ncbi:hypothetical protein GC173_15510 [bacterium]|nr:hypothetical protein [bacterium]
MAASPQEVQAKLDRLLKDGWITQRQSERIMTMVAGGGVLEDALTELPILATRDLKQAFAGPPKPSRQDKAPIPLAVSPAPPKTPTRPEGQTDLDPDLTFEDEEIIETNEFAALDPEAVQAEEARITESAVRLPTLSHPSRDPKELVSLTVQEPAGSVLPGEEQEDTSENDALVDDLDLDLDMDDFDFGHDETPAPAHDLDDDLILPEDDEPDTLILPKGEGPAISETDVSFLFDEAFESGEANAVSNAVVGSEEPAPGTLPLPINPAEFIKGKAPAPLNLATHQDEDALAIAYDLLGESLVLGRRGVRLDLRKQRQNVALYAPDGKLEEERTLPTESLATVSMKIKQMARLLPHVKDPQRGYARLEFEGEKARGLVATDGGEPGRDVVTVYLLSE